MVESGERAIGGKPVMRCQSCGASVVREDDGEPTTVDPDMRLDEREGA